MRRTQFLLLPAIVIAFILGGRLLVADPVSLVVAAHECKRCTKCECTPDDNCGCILAVAEPSK